VEALSDRSNVYNFGVSADESYIAWGCTVHNCQDLSVAGRRAGLHGERSGLWWQFRRIVREFRPRWVLVENVPGLLSSRGGRDFAVVLRGLVKCGYCVAWRILDAQYFGLAQRRRRVFLVASLGSGRAAQVLFEPVSLPRDPAQGRKAWQDVAGTLGSCSARGGRRATDLDGAGAYIAGALTSRIPTSDASCACQGHIMAHPDPAYAVTGSGSRFGSGRDNQDTYVFSHQAGGDQRTRIVRAGDYAGALRTRGQDAVAGSFGVRRLTPLECERLQGFPDGWTGGQSDTARYRQLGNAVPVPVVAWIGRRLAAADSMPGSVPGSVPDSAADSGGPQVAGAGAPTTAPTTGATT
jgi:DNA (cytosine-5)-methyltransferase 1